MRGLLVMGLLLATACGTGGGAGQVQRELLRAVDATERAPRTYIYSETTRAGEVQVRGEVQDDLRFTATMLVGDREVSQVVVADDALAVRFPDPALVPSLAGVESDDPPTAEALGDGRWAVDHTAAPPLSAPVTREGSLVVGQDAVLDARYVFQYLRRAITDAAGVVEFNADDLEYNPRDDPFADFAPARGSGTKRYDLRPPPLPRRSERGTTAAMPTTSMFRKMAFFVRDERLVRVMEDIDVEAQREFRRAVEAGRPQYFLDLLEAVREGRTREPVRERGMRYVAFRIGEPRTVELPLDAFPGSLQGLAGIAAPDGERRPAGG